MSLQCKMYYIVSRIIYLLLWQLYIIGFGFILDFDISLKVLYNLETFWYIKCQMSKHDSHFILKGYSKISEVFTKIFCSFWSRGKNERRHLQPHLWMMSWLLQPLPQSIELQIKLFILFVACINVQADLSKHLK